MRMGASLRNARAKEIRCRSPPESFIPRSPTRVSYPFGRFVMNSWAFAAVAAAINSFLGGLGRGELMFSDHGVEDINDCWWASHFLLRRRGRSSASQQTLPDGSC